MITKKIKALVLFSGGLDSLLAVKVLQEQNIDVTAVCFCSNFFSCDKAIAGAEAIGAPLLTVDISEEMVGLVKDPPNGHGKNMNPCLDCHAQMFRMAGELSIINYQLSIIKQKYDIIASGEVLGQRPYSQNKRALQRVCGLAGREILRPLSAKLLPETEYEKTGLADRAKLLDICGRSRERQMALAAEYKIAKYPAPAGGCLLTERDYSLRLKHMLNFWPDCTGRDVELLKHGRVFWLKWGSEDVKYALAVVGRNQDDNAALARLAQTGDFVLQLKQTQGPLALLRFANTVECGMEAVALGGNETAVIEIETEVSLNAQDVIKKAARMIAYYSLKTRGKEAVVEVRRKN